MDPVSILGPLWEALGNHFGSQNVSKNRVKFRGRFLKGKKAEKKRWPKNLERIWFDTRVVRGWYNGGSSGGAPLT